MIYFLITNYLFIISDFILIFSNIFFLSIWYKVNGRAWKDTRTAITKCNSEKGMVLNADRNYLTKAEMCAGFQLILTVPGNGVWSWATKFNLVSNYYRDDNIILIKSRSLLYRNCRIIRTVGGDRIDY